MPKHSIRLLTIVALAGATYASWISLATAQSAKSAKSAAPSLDVKTLKAVDQKYQSAKSVSMKVEKTLVLGLLGQERKSSGTLALSGGRLRMELEGAEKTLLVVNKKNLWAVTFPPAEFKDAAVQVIKGDSSSKKGRSQSIVSLLSLGGFLKFFSVRKTETLPSGEIVFHLSPQKEQIDFKRALVTISPDRKQISELRYWDDRDNETRLRFTDVVFGAKVDDKMFNYNPPANADVMAL